MYRESNASRLRQEIKGMVVTGIVKGESRSKSPTPNKSSTSPNSPKQTNMGITQKVADNKVCPVLVSARFPNSNISRSGGRLDDSDRALDLLATSRIRDTSNSGKEPQDRVRRVLSNVSTQHVVDTRSKTLNTASRQSASQETVNSTKKPLTQTNIVHSTELGTGYGKPLVTSFNKKLTIMKERPANLCDMKDVMSCRGKSPYRLCRTKHNDSVSSLPGKKIIDTIKSKSPDKGATGKMGTSNTVPKIKPLDKNMIIKNALSLNQSKVRSSTYINRQNKESPTRLDKFDKIATPNNSNNRCNPVKSSCLKENKCLKPEFDLSVKTNSNHINRTRIPVSVINKPSPATPKSVNGDSPGVRSPRSNSKSPTPSIERKKEKLSDSFRQTINERLKHSHNNGKPIFAIGRPTFTATVCSRNFKPQLEDIKSSFMLLNKTQDHTRSTNERGYEKQDFDLVNKSKLYYDDYRKQQLIETKKKFKSKNFFQDQKYDKIEGLNWISWK